MTDTTSVYLGDGLYASTDGYQIGLTADPNTPIERTVYLEGPVYAALQRYAASHGFGAPALAAPTLDAGRVDAALRAAISGLDYDLHKNVEADEETGQDGYPTLVAAFIRDYQEGAS